ncbi:related to Endo-beta-1,4-glucanase D [Rhynchosporium secalis]|uniref:AA9 family lytic polysaccharide monooxygenase n=1 Tax=Rhynchosporium secalis TaxID=38038 RepID=A0A1E1MIB2_RHYSE|nr:related to Endo-beta-1,4-glucanase D [Rhynchosporium secalis]
MKYSQVLIGAAAASLASAHATIYNVWVNDVDQGTGNSAAGYIRSPPNNSPIKDITSKDMTCNVNNVAAAKTINVAAGDKISLEWHHNNNSPADDIIDSTHKGPVMVYIAPAASNGEGDVWVKLAEDGYDGSQWAVQKLIANKGKHDFILPSTLADNKYLIRGEIIALHEADSAYSANPGRGAQFYMECVQISVSGGGSTLLPAGVSIPGAYSDTDPGVVFNLYGGFTSYKIPGPAVWNGGSSGTAPKPPTTTPAVPISGQAPGKAEDPKSTPIATPAPVATSAKSPCKPKTSSDAPKPTKTPCTGKTPTTMATVATPAVSGTSAASGATVALYGQCGGQNYQGPTTCASGSTCTNYNPWYSQCVAA